MGYQTMTEKALEAVKKVFEDTSVPQAETRRRLDSIRDEIDELLDTLD